MSFKSAIVRKKPHREPKQRFLIFCEGEKTEPCYFRSFRLVTATIKPLHIQGGNALLFVQNSITEWQSLKTNYDQGWVVFDKDHSTDLQFTEAIHLTAQNQLKLACSNQAFEYWFVLHFQNHTGQPMPRTSYNAALNPNLSFPYAKDERTAKKMYDALIPYQANAIIRAERNWNNQGPQESSTAVFKLVRQLNKYL